MFTFKKHAEWCKFVLTALESAGYHIVFKVINSEAYVPQTRDRFYMIGIRSDVRRKNVEGIPIFPDYSDVGLPVVPLSKLIKPIDPPGWQLHPDENAALFHKNNVMKHYKKASEESVNPFIVETPVIIDFKASEKFSHHKVKICPTLTKRVTIIISLQPIPVPLRSRILGLGFRV